MEKRSYASGLGSAAVFVMLFVVGCQHAPAGGDERVAEASGDDESAVSREVESEVVEEASVEVAPWFDYEPARPGGEEWRIAPQDEAQGFLEAVATEWEDAGVFTYFPRECLLEVKVLALPDVTGNGEDDLVVDMTHASVLGECPTTRDESQWPDSEEFIFHGWVTHRILFDGAENRPVSFVGFSKGTGQYTHELGDVVQLEDGRVGFVSYFQDPGQWHYDVCDQYELSIYQSGGLELADEMVRCSVPTRVGTLLLRYYEGNALVDSTALMSGEHFEQGDRLVGAGDVESDGTKETFYELMTMLIADEEVEVRVVRGDAELVVLL